MPDVEPPAPDGVESVGPGVGGARGAGAAGQVESLLPGQEPPAELRVPGGGAGQEQARLVASLQDTHLLHTDRWASKWKLHVGCSTFWKHSLLNIETLLTGNDVNRASQDQLLGHTAALISGASLLLGNIRTLLT